ncbi:uncharacterized protein A4U43_C06F3490 [Asparagus officinalis]|uniref:FYVE-type domain-containing protein n=1 Tax=Asparagus officinalis TaxID=4686 RepID=A0A5P1EJS8_ASPOF|nr:uncharacterized protein LOC109845053 [Asparagus officinalis]ONK66034.1 uncharacterized protein A4U43_C06F3490 [Asparagus officinalis]
MVKIEGTIPFSSAYKHDRESRDDENFISDLWGAAEKVTNSISTGSLKPSNLYSSNLIGEYDWENDLSICTQPRANPEVNLKNLFGGLVSIIFGHVKNFSGIQHQQTSNSNASFLGSGTDGDSFLHPSVCVPSAPPLLIAEAVHYSAYREVLEAEPPEWIPDSHANSCMKCDSPFTAITRGRHHCRFCGGIFCRACSKGRCLLPIKFREREPQRVCDICYDRLDPLQGILINSISNAMQSAKHDVMDWTCTRGWLNLPLGLSMEHEIYKAANTLRSYCQVARLNPEKSIPLAILKGAKGLAILTVAKAGALLTYKLGTGLVVSRRSDGSWSAPSAIASVGLGWGAQIGGEIMDFMIVLHGSKAVKAFTSRMHCSVGAGLSVAAGPVGRVVEADIRAGDRGSGMCYTYSCSKGAFVGVSLEGNIVATRTDTNLKFYGDPYMSTTDILLGNVESPKAAAPLYASLDDLFSKIGR